VRLPELEHRHPWYARAFLAVVRRVSGREPPDVLKTLYFRPGFFGMRFSALTQGIMRGESPWSVGERELFAAYTSVLNQCVF
jgi:hypothetical protein